MLNSKLFGFIFIIAFCINNIAIAQDAAKKTNENPAPVVKNPGKTDIICDERLTGLMKTKLSLSESNPTIEGYRVQIYFASGNNSRKMVNDVRTQFLIKHPDVGAYEIWQAPNFKVRVGDFRTKLEAYKFYKEIKADFPSSFIVTDNIALPKLD